MLIPLCLVREGSEDGVNHGSETGTLALEGLIKVFREALEVLSQLIVTGRRYRCIWYSPGARYDPMRMRTEPELSEEGSEGAVVELSILPGIEEVPMHCSRAGSGTFISSGGGFVTEEAGDCLIPAVVSIAVAATAQTGLG